MKALVYPKNLDIGGSQLVAIDLAAAVHRLGHDVTIFARPGPLAQRAMDRGVRVIEESKLVSRAASLPSIHALHNVVARERPDVLHAYESRQCLHALFAARLGHAVSTVGSIMSFRVPWYLPTSLPLVIGASRKIRDFERRWPPHQLTLLPPPVDTDEYRADLDPSGVVRDLSLDPGEPTICLVSRLEVPFKWEGIERAVSAVGLVAESCPVRFVIVGAGRALGRVRHMADDINSRTDRETVVVAGELLDPLPIYAAADVVIGSGLSVLRGMACSKAAIVLGREGFSEIVTPESIDRLSHRGFYGVGDGDRSPDRLAKQLSELLDHPARRAELGRFARSVVCERFDLAITAKALISVYERVADMRLGRLNAALDASASMARLLRYRRLESRLEVEAARQGHVGDRADAFVYPALADRVAPRPSDSRPRRKAWRLRQLWCASRFIRTSKMSPTSRVGEVIHPLHHRDLREFFAFYRAQLGWAPDRRTLRRHVRRSPAFAVRDATGKLCGFAYTVDFSPDILELANICLMPEVRNRGLGNRLVSAVEDDARARGFAEIILVNSILYRTKDARRPATKFYERLGYRLVVDTGPSKVFAKPLR